MVNVPSYTTFRTSYIITLAIGAAIGMQNFSQVLPLFINLNRRRNLVGANASDLLFANRITAHELNKRSTSWIRTPPCGFQISLRKIPQVNGSL